MSNDQLNINLNDENSSISAACFLKKTSDYSSKHEFIEYIKSSKQKKQYLNYRTIISVWQMTRFFLKSTQYEGRQAKAANINA